ncbi:hypothetical protein [Thalassobellus citreus]|uniref:hypothetical protein n=1 Tax=Thalassobellus citreus TaxID=3367752 RepID=UPI0037BC8703
MQLITETSLSKKVLLLSLGSLSIRLKVNKDAEQIVKQTQVEIINVKSLVLYSS